MEWKVLAEAVPGNLQALALAASGADGLFASVDSAHRALGVAVRTLRTIPPGPADGELGGAFASACAALEGAHRELARLDAVRFGAACAFDLYALLAGPYDALPYRTWRGHSHDAGAAARDAAGRLLDAASEARAAESLLRASRSFPDGSLRWWSWRKAARRLAIDAADNAKLALDAVRRTRDALVLESFDTGVMLNG
ncbi:unnamed protein product [Urochloa decumbens]|uniref:Uncharacterized protein n=1 Tax=Urochloa decumbens TaxID=240449 RepID=A0ABC9BZ37_9POAL